MFVTLVLCSPSASIADERFAVIVSGAPGGEKYAAQQQTWRAALTASLASALSFPESNVAVLSHADQGTSRATAENVRRLLGDMRRRLKSEDTLLLVLMGHGTFDGSDAKFNLVGPDLTAQDWKALLAPLPGRLVVVNTTESSFPFLEELSQRGRVVITATDSAAQRFATVFPEYFVRALADPSIDTDKNGRVSVWEAFSAASTAVRQHYEQRGQLSTERPLLDDDGDRVGREADAPAGEDGALAKAIYLTRPVSPDASVAALDRQRLALEAQIEELRAAKATMAAPDYEAALEKLLVGLARVSQRIRLGS